MVQNGRVQLARLERVEDWAYLAPGAARAWRAFDAEMTALTGTSLTITKPDGAYRTYNRQQYWWNNYLKHGKPVAAHPGYSNHGLGMAVDINNQGVYNRSTLVKVARKHNFFFDTPSENWHVVYRGSADYNSANSTGSKDYMFQPIKVQNSPGSADDLYDIFTPYAVLTNVPQDEAAAYVSAGASLPPLDGTNRANNAKVASLRKVWKRIIDSNIAALKAAQV
jgi:hypothetical protein